MRTYFMESERISFSYWSQDDVDLARSLWGDPEVTKLITHPGGFSEEEVYARLALEMENQMRFSISYLPIFEKASDAFLGCCGLRPFQAEQGIFEIGFHLMRSAWGKGYASEAAQAVVRHAFSDLGVKEIVAGHHPENAASRVVLLRLGFCPIGDRFYPPTGLNHPAYSLKNPTEVV